MGESRCNGRSVQHPLAFSTGWPGAGQSTATSQPLFQNAIAKRVTTGQRLVSVSRILGPPDTRSFRLRRTLFIYVGRLLNAQSNLFRAPAGWLSCRGALTCRALDQQGVSKDVAP